MIDRNDPPRLWAELAGILWEYNFNQEFDKTSYNTVERVQQKMYEKEHILEALNRMTDEERLELFDQFCKHCGSKNIGCQCWNDE